MNEVRKLTKRFSSLRLEFYLSFSLRVCVCPCRYQQCSAKIAKVFQFSRANLRFGKVSDFRNFIVRCSSSTSVKIHHFHVSLMRNKYKMEYFENNHCWKRLRAVSSLSPEKFVVWHRNNRVSFRVLFLFIHSHWSYYFLISLFTAFSIALIRRK